MASSRRLQNCVLVKIIISQSGTQRGHVGQGPCPAVETPACHLYPPPPGQDQGQTACRAQTCLKSAAHAHPWEGGREGGREERDEREDMEGRRESYMKRESDVGITSCELYGKSQVEEALEKSQRLNRLRHGCCA